MIKLPYGYGIKADTNCYLFGEVTTNKAGSEDLKNVTYHNNIKSCMQKLLEIKQRTIVANKILTLQETIKEFANLQKEFTKILDSALNYKLNDTSR